MAEVQDTAAPSLPGEGGDGAGLRGVDVPMAGYNTLSDDQSIERPPMWDMTNGLLTPALWWAEQGFAVMPLRRGTNRPHQMLGTGWTFATIGSTDPSVIRAWWSQSPAANIGVVTGAPSRLVVVDVDVKGGVDGYASLATSGLDLPETVTARTPSGGQHLFFRLPDGCGHVPSPVGLLPGVDIRADGTQVAVAPSQREFTPRLDMKDNPRWSEPYYLPYELTPGRLAMASGGLLAAIKAGPVGRSSPGTSGAPGDVLPSLDWFIEHGFRPGSRNRDCYRLALRLLGRFSGDDATVVGLIHRAWAATCQVPEPFPWREAYGAVSSARRTFQAGWQRDIAAAESLMRWPS